MRKIWFVVLIAATSLLSSGISSKAAPATSLEWNSQTLLKGEIRIPKGQIVTVAPQTKIVVQDGTRITIDGNLKATAGLSLVGKSWKGLVINGSVEIKDFQESGAITPFQVNRGGSFVIIGGTVSKVGGASKVEGTFVADSLHYDKGTGNGINSEKGTGSITINNSVLTGAGKDTGDFFGMYGIKSITLTNSTMTGAHCAFHVLNLQDMKLDHVSITGNSFGFMMHGSSDIGSKTISNTEIKNNLFGFDEGSKSTHNGVIVITNSSISKNNQDLGQFTGKVKIVSPVA